MKRVLCFGIVVVDRVYELDALPAGEGKLTARAYRETGGGIAGTAAVAIAALGGEARFCGALGADAAGDFLHAEMAARGVDVAAVRRVAGARTPSSCVLVDRAGERALIVDRGTAAAAAPADEALAGVHAVMVDHRFPQAASALLLRASVPAVLDAEGGAPEELSALVALAAYPVFSRNGLLICTGESDPERGLARVEAPRARAVGVTLGGEGSLWRVAGETFRIGAPSLAMRDTTGCGDVFHGAFALAIAEERRLPDAIRFATAAAALKGRNGAGWRGMASRAEVAALLREAW